MHLPFDLSELFESELGYVVLLFGLFVVPRFLQRWRLPTAITSFALGAIGGAGFGLFAHDTTLHLLATFGIVALFLFAGLEVDVGELRQGTRVLAEHLTVRIALLALVAFAGARLLDLPPRPAILLSLALVIPSTGFILDSLATMGLTKEETFWVKSKAIATELLALTVLFVVLQSTSALRLALASLAIVTMIAVLPLLFRFFAASVAPWAPKSEFAFLVMMAVVMAYITRQLGAYYLVGAFLVGIAARRLRATMPSEDSERMLHAVEVFASFFAPFYFFVAGTSLRSSDFTLTALLGGLALTAIAGPLRILSVIGHRRVRLGEPAHRGIRIALPMLPTLIFTLVVAGILREQFAIADDIFGALIVYAVCNTTLPGLIMRTPPPAYDAPELPEMTSRPGATA
jgi:Kef-type K+ transport system membrane component KefB